MKIPPDINSIKEELKYRINILQEDYYEITIRLKAKDESIWTLKNLLSDIERAEQLALDAIKANQIEELRSQANEKIPSPNREL